MTDRLLFIRGSGDQLEVYRIHNRRSEEFHRGIDKVEKLSGDRWVRSSSRAIARQSLQEIIDVPVGRVGTSLWAATRHSLLPELQEESYRKNVLDAQDFGSPEEFVAVLRVLNRIQNPRLSEEVRLKEIEALPLTSSARIFDLLCRLAQEDPQDSIRQAAIRKIGKNTHLLTLIQDTSEQKNCCAERTLKALVQMLQSPSSGTRREASFALAAQTAHLKKAHLSESVENVVVELHETYHNNNGYEKIQADILKAIGKIHHPDSLELILKACQSESAGLRRAAVKALVEFKGTGQSQTLKVLTKLAKSDPAPSVKQAAQFALWVENPATIAPFLNHYLKEGAEVTLDVIAQRVTEDLNQGILNRNSENIEGYLALEKAMVDFLRAELKKPNYKVNGEIFSLCVLVLNNLLQDYNAFDKTLQREINLEVFLHRGFLKHGQKKGLPLLVHRFEAQKNPAFEILEEHQYSLLRLYRRKA